MSKKRLSFSYTPFVIVYSVDGFCYACMAFGFY